MTKPTRLSRKAQEEAARLVAKFDENLRAMASAMAHPKEFADAADVKQAYFALIRAIECGIR